MLLLIQNISGRKNRPLLRSYYIDISLAPLVQQKKGMKHMEKDKHLGLRIDSETHKKLKDLAEYEGRSINGEVLYLIRQAIRDYETKNIVHKQ